MKTIMVLIASLAAPPLWASGLTCQSTCLDISLSGKTIYSAETLTISAGSKIKNDVFGMLAKKCKNISSYTGLLAKDFKSEEIVESGRESSTSYARTYTRLGYWPYYGYANYVSSYSSYASSWHYKHEVNLFVLPATSKESCQVNEDIKTGEMPYVGNLPIL
jgi:hypothetical protein